MNHHLDNNHQQLQQLQNRRTLTNTPATRHRPHVPNINNIHENELADGRNLIQGMLTQIKELYKDVITLTEERNQLKIDYAVLQRETSDLKRQVANFQTMEQQRQKAEEDKRKVAPVQSAMKGLTLHLESSQERVTGERR
ncbi:hypothetical protein KI688_011363 [Linnemannia hyalina]|uniref:Uncharacterized protein n=1 Tax=Linnemannia hyalina TaxID=64524 RepID=A0A9P7XV83_9FUNG|nr:hypothetical protein KI688_011363 [Linnemannia hyalina]